MEKRHHNEDEGKRPISADPPVFPLQHVIALLSVVILSPPTLLVTARPKCVHLDILFQEFNIVLSEKITIYDEKEKIKAFDVEHVVCVLCHLFE